FRKRLVESSKELRTAPNKPKPILSYNHKETASFFDLKDFLLSLASDNHSTASSFQPTWPSRRSTAFVFISRHLPFSLSTFPQAWVPVEAALDFEPTRYLLQDM